jgi:hypothetical protein
MKKVYIICAVIIVLGAGSSMAQQYAIDDLPGNGGKNFVTAIYLEGMCGQACVDIFLKGVDGHQNAGGFWLDFTNSTNDISYVSAGRALTDGSEGLIGPWRPDGGVIVNEPAGTGTLLMQVLNLTGASPDGDGDLIIGQFCLRSIGATSAIVMITTIPSVTTWTPLDDSLINSGVLTVVPVCPCYDDAACDDGIWCNGYEYCDPPTCGYCFTGTPPCPDDGDGDPCTQSGCIEPEWGEGTCIDNECAATSHFDPCCNEPVCDGAPACYCWGDFDCDEDVDADDIATFLEDFGRSVYYNPCTNENSCNADFNCDGNVDAGDLTKFLEDFGRSQFNNPCPACVGWWCAYP